MSEWKTVSIRRELIKEIENVVNTGRYRSISEFISEAIRLRLEELVRTGTIKTTRSQELSISDEFHYSSKHTWVQKTAEGNVRIGISDFARRKLEGLAKIRIEPVGHQVNKMEIFGTAETWFFLFDLYSPVSGKIIKVNDKLKENPQLVKKDPYGDGWLIELRPISSLILGQELASLQDAREYDKWIDKLDGRSSD